MACTTSDIGGGTTLHICWSKGETKRVPNRRRKAWWCFRCRKRLLHTLMGFYPPMYSYYGPNYWWECPQCHEEHVLFPGREWVYNE